MSVRLKPQGGSFTIIRSIYDSHKSRGIESTIGSFKADSANIPDEFLQQLSAEEQGQLQAKFLDLQIKKRVSDSFDTLKNATTEVQKIAAALRRHARFGSDEEAQKLYAAIADLKLSMREAGYKQQRAKQEPAPVLASNDATKAAAAAAGLGAKNTGKKS